MRARYVLEGGVLVKVKGNRRTSVGLVTSAAEELLVTYAAAVTAAGGTLSTSTRAALLTYLEAVAALPTPIMHFPWVTDTLASAMLPLEGLGTYSLVNTNFVSGDYAEPDGVSAIGKSGAYFNTAQTLSTSGPLSFGIWHRSSAVTPTGVHLWGIRGSSDANSVRWRAAGGTADLIWKPGGASITESNSTYYSGSNSGAATGVSTYYKDGVLQGSSTTPTTAQTEGVYLFGHPATAPAVAQVQACSCLAWNVVLTAAEHLAFHNALRTLQNNLTRG